jgi:hypothetical protein
MIPLAAGRTGAFAAVTVPATRVARVGRRVMLALEWVRGMRVLLPF